jgi:thioredoxin-like negative regulator of GroEL
VVAIDAVGSRDIIDLQGKPNTEAEFAGKLNARSVPTVIFLDENAREVLRFRGIPAGEKLDAMLDYVIGHHEKTQNFEAYLEQRVITSP